MDEKIYQFLLNSLEQSNQAVLLFEKNKETPFLSNKQAKKYFKNEEGNIQISGIFIKNEASQFLRSSVVEQLENYQNAIIYDMTVVTNTGTHKMCDVQLGYADEEKNTIFLEMFFKEDKRMSTAISQVNQAPRAEGILDFDENLSLIHCNDLFHAIFEFGEEGRNGKGNFGLSKGLQAEIREKLVAEIHKNLEKQPHYIMNIKVLSKQGEEHWYALELQRRTLDYSGTDKIMASLVNIEKQMEMEADLKNINRLFDTFQELSEDLLFRVDIQNKLLIRRSDRATRFGLKENVVKFPDAVLESGSIHQDDRKIYMQFAERALSGVAGSVEVRMREEGKSEFGFRRITWLPVESEDGTIHEVIGKLVDVQTVKELEERANYDALTNALNKRAMLESTSEILNQASANEKHALFFMDLDDFKYVNDNLGHAFGDYLLSELGRRLGESVRSKDLVGRVGGDEFILFLRDVPSADILMGKAKILLSTISEDFMKGEIHHNIHGSIGISVFPDHGRTYEELYHHGDLALYHSKKHGKNQVTIYSNNLKEK